MAPAKTPKNTAHIDKSLASMRSHTETRTANTVKAAAAIRRFEINFLPPPVKPIRSTYRDIAVCPAIEATE